MRSLRSETLILTSSLNSPDKMTAEWASYRLDFKFEARTSRESMRHKDTYFVRIPRQDGSGYGYGECALFKGLSSDDCPDYEMQLSAACANPAEPSSYSSIRFGIETALINAGYSTLPSSPFMRGEEGIPINGLVWMGDKELMRKRIDEKLADGFDVIKLKIGGIDFESELQLLAYIRSRYSSNTLQLRLDANGSFTPENAMAKLERLSSYDIHSIEQPIKARQAEDMHRLCRLSPIPIALDEELIGTPTDAKISLILDYIKPQYIILKPALCGGLSGATLWANKAERRNIGWWATSALESNVGLQAIARWTSMRGVTLPQGLGTGQLYYNNVKSGLYLQGQLLFNNPDIDFEMPQLIWHR